MDGLFAVPDPTNEPVRDYAPGSAERDEPAAPPRRAGGERLELTMTIDGEQRMAAGEPIDVVQPHRHRHVLGRHAQRDAPPTPRRPSTAAKRAAPAGGTLPFDERAAVFLRAADLLAGPWRDTLNARDDARPVEDRYQAEIDAACELIDFLRFNVHFAQQILAEQPMSSPGVWNRFDHRPLEGFVYAITPFNFTAIAGNLPTAPALMGNTVVWKPSPTQQLVGALHHAAVRGGRAAARRDQHGHRRRPRGVRGRAGRPRPGRHPLHRLDRDLPAPVADRRARTSRGTASYPRLVGETGGKDFVIAHPVGGRWPRCTPR